MPKSEKRSFRYQERSREDLKERANMRGGNFDDYILPKYKKFKPKEGKNLIRVLPPTWPDARHYGYDIYVNYNIGPDNQAYLSLSKHKKGKDPIAEACIAAGREGDDKLMRDLQPRQRILFWMIDRNEEDEGPMLWAAPFTFDKALANISFDEDTKEVVYIDDPEKGCDMRFYREGTGLKTDYDASKMKLLAESPLHEDEKLQNDWLDYIQDNPVPECLQFYDYEHISSVFNGGAAPSNKEAEDAPPPRRAKPPVPADEDDPPFDDAKPARRRPVVAEAEEDEPPARSRTRVTKAPPEEEDDPPPRGRSGGGEPKTESIRQRIARKRAEAEAEDD